MNGFNYPFVTNDRKEIVFSDGNFINLPKEYMKKSNQTILKEFYSKILTNESVQEIKTGIDPLGFTYLNLDFICYVGLVCSTKQKGKYNNLCKKHPENRFPLEYLKKQIQFEHDLVNFKEYIPIDLVTQNLHEIRGFNSKIAMNIDKIMKIDDEEEWETKFESQSETIKKIYVGSRLIKFILDNVRFYIPDFFENLKLNYDRTFIAHRSISKIVKIFRNDFKKDRADIDFRGSSKTKIKGDKEYFEILIKIQIENALKYSEFPKRIGPKVIISDCTNDLIIEVHSYGRAIPETEHPYLFSKGFRSSANRRTKEGTGMGLYNAKQLCRHFKAKIDFRCEDVSKDQDIDLAWNIFTITIKKNA